MLLIQELQAQFKMDRHRSSNTHRDEIPPRPSARNKQNSREQQTYLIQNENEVLRMKNNDLNVKINELKLQVQNCAQSIALRETQVENIRSSIGAATYKDDIEIQRQKKMLVQKLALLRTQQDMLLRKIQETKELTIFEEEKIGAVQRDKKMIEMEVLSLRAQNQGTKLILRNLEGHNQKLKQQNQVLVGRRKVNEPKQQAISIQIQERIRIIKSQQQTLKSLKKQQSTKLLSVILNNLYMQKNKQNLLKIQRYGLLKKIAYKKVMQLALIRRKYLLSVKARIMDQLRKTFKPLAQQQAARRIIEHTCQRRIKAAIWLTWRRISKEKEFQLTRKFQFNNLLQKLTVSFEKTNLFASFTHIKNFRDSPLRQRSALIIQSIVNACIDNQKRQFFSILRKVQHSDAIASEIDASSHQQSVMLVKSMYFSGWFMFAKARRIENKNLKYRYFKQMKLLIGLKNRRILGQMLIQANQRINNVDTESKVFSQMKKQMTVSKIDILTEQQKIVIQKNKAMQQDRSSMHIQKKLLYQQLALLKVSKYLKTKVQRAFDIWRQRQQQTKVVLTIVNLIESKKACDKNFAFSKILKKRFAMLKKSIADKIQSCEFSYNYLLEENRHIKQVLDKKQHQLDKTKFVKILKKIMRTEKQIKLKYFYKFMASGFKFWRVRKALQRMQIMTNQKIKVVFMWLLKQQNRVQKEEENKQRFIVQKENAINKKLMKNAFNGFISNSARNRNLKQLMGGIFDRNLQIHYFTAFGRIKQEQSIYNRSVIQGQIDQIQNEINVCNAASAEEETQIQILSDRLVNKQQILRERKILGLYQFFVRHIKIKVGSCVKRWHARVKRQGNVLQFASILQRKSRSILKHKFLMSINRKNQDYNINDLQQKLSKYKGECEALNSAQEQFVKNKQEQSLKMKNQVQFFKKDGQNFQKKIDLMVNIKLKKFKRQWNKKKLRLYFSAWTNNTLLFEYTWVQLDKNFKCKILAESFQKISTEIKSQMRIDRLKHNLAKIYHKTFRYNASLGFRIWNFVYLKRNLELWKEQERVQLQKFQALSNRYTKAVAKHNEMVDFRAHDSFRRTIFNEWKRQTLANIFTNMKQEKLQVWLKRGYCSSLMKMMKHRHTKKIIKSKRIQDFQKKWEQKRIRSFFEVTSRESSYRKSILRLFISKFCPFVMRSASQDFLYRLKNFTNHKIIILRTQQCDKLQQVLQTFQKKRKDILNTYWRRWNRNEYIMRIQYSLMRKVTRNAMNMRVRDLFYAWKLQTEAKRVRQMHQEEGEVRKRIIEIARLKIFLNDFKKDKGLLLQNEGGELVLSPRFQQKKQKQIKHDNNLRYKFISRLILSMNGYAAPVKAYNNLKLYMTLRQKYKKFALMVHNNLRKTELSFAFRIWHKATKEFNQTFETMDRKDLIRILNRQKDKMQMQYTKKVTLEQKIHQEMSAHKILVHQQDRKERLSALILLKNYRKVKLYGLLAWKERVSQIRQAELADLQQKANQKMKQTEEQVTDLEELQRELRDNNIKLQQAVREAVEIADMVKRITEERDKLSELISQKELTCESLQEENEELNSRLYEAQKQAMNLLIISGENL